MPSTPGKFAMSVEAIAQAEVTSVGAVQVLLGRALRKLRRAGLICTCRELAEALDANRREGAE